MKKGKTQPYRRLSGSDAMFAYLDSPNAYHHTIKISIIDPSTDPDGWCWEKYLQYVNNTIHYAPMLRQRCMKTPFGMHYPVWVDDPGFDLEHHVRRIACPAPGGRDEFCKLVADLYSQPLNPDRPLWQVWIIEGLENGEVGVLHLLHHAYADGAAVMSIMDEFLTERPTTLAANEQPDWNPPKLPSAARRLFWGLKDLPGLFVKNLPSLVRGVIDSRRINRQLDAEGAEKPPSPFDESIPKPFSYRIKAPARRFSCQSFDLADIRYVSNTLGFTINDVFMSCVGGALHRYLNETGHKLDLPTLASMPFNAVPLEQRDQPGNFSTIGHVTLSSHIMDPMERLRATAQACKVTKNHFANTRDSDLRSLMNLLHPYLMVFANWMNEVKGGGVFPISNITLSNVPGPRTKRYMLNWEVKEWYSTGQLNHGVALNMTAWSYADQFNICALSDRGRGSDTWQLLNLFNESLEELLEIASSQQSTDLKICA